MTHISAEIERQSDFDGTAYQREEDTEISFTLDDTPGNIRFEITFLDGIFVISRGEFVRLLRALAAAGGVTQVAGN